MSKLFIRLALLIINNADLFLLFFPYSIIPFDLKYCWPTQLCDFFTERGTSYLFKPNSLTSVCILRLQHNYTHFKEYFAFQEITPLHFNTCNCQVLALKKLHMLDTFEYRQNTQDHFPKRMLTVIVSRHI